MSQSIDNQIVKMQFDNASFEKNAQQSMSTLDKLKQALKFDKVNMTPLQQAFSETEATATKAGFHIRDIWLKVGNIIEQEVAQKVVNAGKKIFNALTMEGISDGFKEYELKMGSIQTIMAGTGESLATVNKYLDELNTYSDKTIYSFADMTNNIGKFTNAGVKLDDAVNAIKGIANEAAVSGANANEASRAMYNFSQALSAGYVKLIDWKSIENANMATKEFKDTLLEMGTACGTVEKASDGMYRILSENNKGKTMEDLVSGTKNFNDSLQYQWMTTEVLTKTLKIYATDIRSISDAEREAYENELKAMGLSDEQIKRFEELGQKATDAASEIKTFSMLMDTLKEAIGSGWAMSWQLMIGDFEQAKALWTNVGNTLSGVIDGISDARNNFLKVGLRTGWEKTLAGGGLKDVIPDAEKFRGILVDLAHEQGVLNKEQYDGIYSTETLMKSLHEYGWMSGDLLKEAVSDYLGILKSMSDEELSDAGFDEVAIKNLESFNNSLQKSTTLADDFAKSMNELGGRENVIQGLSNIFHSLLGVLRPISTAFNDVFGVLDPTKLFDLTKRFREFTEQLKVSEDASNTLKTSFTLAFGGIKTILSAVITTIKGVTKLILPLFNLFDAIFGLIGKVVSALTGSKGALDAADKFTKIGDKISDKYLGAMQKLADFINKVADAIRGIPDATIFRKIHDGVESAINALKDFWEAFKEMPIIQQMVSDFNNAIAEIERRITPVIDSVRKGLDGLKRNVKDNFNLTTLNNVLTVVYNKLKNFVTLIKDFATRIKNFFKNLKEGKSIVESFRESFGDIIERVKELKDNLKTFFEDLFSKGDELGGKFDLEKIQQAIHDFVTNITPEQVTMIAVAGTFMLIAINMLRLSEAMRNAVEAFTGIGVALKNVINSYIKKQKSTILQVAEAIVIVAASLWVLSTIPKDKLDAAVDALMTLTGLIGILTVVLTACGIAMHKFGGERSMVELAAGLVFVSGSFMVAALSLKVLEYVNLKGILPKLGVMAGVMVAMVGLSLLMGKLDKFNKGSLTMIAAAGSLLIAAEAMRRIGQIPNESIDKAMDAMLKIMLGIAAISFASGKIGIFSAVGLIAIVMTIDKILPAIENIVNYDYTKIQEGLSNNEAMLKKLAGVLVIMTGIGMIAGNRIKGVGIAMLSIAATFGILLGIAKLAGMMRPSELAQGEKFLWHMAGIVSLIELFSKKAELGMWGGKNGGEGTKAYIRIAVAMGIMLGIAKLASMMDAKDLLKGEAALVGLTGIIWLMTKVASMSQDTKGVIKSISVMLFGLSLILAEVALLSMIPFGKMVPALAAILSILGVMALLALALSKTTSVVEGVKPNWAGMAAFIGAMVAIGFIGRILRDLSKESSEGVMTAAGSMVAIIGAIALLSRSLGSVGGKFSAKQVQAFIGAVLLVAIAAGVLFGLTNFIKKYNLDPNAMLKAAGAISIVLLGLVPALLALNKFGAYTGNKANGGNYKKMITAVGLAVGALVAVGAVIGLLSRFGGDPNSMLAAATSLSIGLIAVCAPLIVLGFVGKKVTDINVPSMVGVVLGAIVALGAVAAAIGYLSNKGNPNTMIQSATALAIGLVAISVPIAVLGAVGKLCSTIAPGGLWAIAISVVGAVGALWAITEILSNFSNNMDLAAIQVLNNAIPILITCMAGISVMAIAIAAAGLIPGNVAAGATAMVSAIGVFIVLIASITMLGMALEELDHAKEWLMTGLDFLVIIAGKLGEAVGALIGGIGVGLTSQLSPMADNLNTFSEKMITFADNIKAIDDEVVTSCGNLAKAMLYLTASEFIDGITRFLGLGGVEGFNFSALGTAIADFCMAIKDVPEDAVTKASVCSVIAKRLAELSDNINLSGGWVQKIIGEKDMSSFASGMANLGHAILSFCQSVKNLPEDAPALAQRASEAATPIVELSKTLYGEGGWVQKIMGEKNLGSFGTNLTSFVVSLKSFVEGLVALEEVSPTYGELIRRCADATTPMIDLAAGIQNAGGWLAKIIGDNTLDAFGSTLIPFINDLRIFVTRLNAMATEVPNYNQLIINVVSTTKHLVELANSLENMGGAAGFFSGDNTLDRFGETLIGFGEGLAAYALSLSGVDLTMIGSANKSITELVQLGSLASGVRSDSFSGLKLALEDISQLPISTVANEIVVGTPMLVENVNAMFQGMINAMVLRQPTDQEQYFTYGKEMLFGIRQGIMRNMSSVYQTLASMANGIKNYMGQALSEKAFYVYGKNVAIGIKKGIHDYKDQVVNEAKAMAEEVNKVIPEKWKEKSPSRIAYGYGKYYAQGAALGIHKYSGEVVTAASDMAEEVVTGANSIITAIAQALDSNMDTQPTIRPVLDTSDIEAKAKSVGSLFDANDLALAYSASGSMKQINEAKNSSNKSADHNQVVSGTQQINFTQNNYSPKALSRIDIYRQTKNEISMLKGAMNNA